MKKILNDLKFLPRDTIIMIFTFPFFWIVVVASRSAINLAHELTIPLAFDGIHYGLSTQALAINSSDLILNSLSSALIYGPVLLKTYRFLFFGERYTSTDQFLSHKCLKVIFWTFIWYFIGGLGQIYRPLRFHPSPHAQPPWIIGSIIGDVIDIASIYAQCRLTFTILSEAINQNGIKFNIIFQLSKGKLIKIFISTFVAGVPSLIFVYIGFIFREFYFFFESIGHTIWMIAFACVTSTLYRESKQDAT